MADRIVERLLELEAGAARVRLEVRYSGSDEIAAALAEKWGQDVHEAGSSESPPQGQSGEAREERKPDEGCGVAATPRNLAGLGVAALALCDPTLHETVMLQNGFEVPFPATIIVGPTPENGRACHVRAENGHTLALLCLGLTDFAVGERGYLTYQAGAHFGVLFWSRERPPGPRLHSRSKPEEF